METEAIPYLFALGTIATTFVGFSAIIMIFRQTVGAGLTPLDSWITLVFIELGFIVTAGSLSAPLLELCDIPQTAAYRSCSGAVALVLAAFAVSYPTRRRRVSGTCTPGFVWIDLFLLVVFIAVLLADALGTPRNLAPGSFAVGLTGTLFTAGVGYLHALGSLHKEAKRATNLLS